MPPEQKMSYAESRDSSFPPYLLNFRHTIGERHVENLKVGRSAYSVIREPIHFRFSEMLGLSHINVLSHSWRVLITSVFMYYKMKSNVTFWDRILIIKIPVPREI
jgi:hypothetical protein